MLAKRRSARFHFTAIVLATMVGIAIGGVSYAVRRNASDDQARDQRATLIAPTDGGFLRGGDKVTLDEAASRVSFDILLPNDPAHGASIDSIGEVWVSGLDDQPTVAVIYTSGVRAILTTWPKGSDPETFYKGLVEQSGAGSVELIEGNPAWVVDADALSPGFPPSSTIDISIGSVEISLTSDLPIDDLREVAASIRVPTGN